MTAGVIQRVQQVRQVALNAISDIDGSHNSSRTRNVTAVRYIQDNDTTGTTIRADNEAGASPQET
jgi:hypothetical protein